MHPPAVVAGQGLGATAYSAAQTRTAGVALDLFAEHGVSGTSLQMIADALGVTKAAVYHQFHAKEAIVVAAVDLELAKLEPALEAAEAQHGDPSALAALLAQVIDLAIGHRRLVGPLLHDPVIVRLLSEHEPYQALMARLFAALLGDANDPQARVRVTMIASAIGGVVMHPLVRGMSHEELRTQLLDLSLQFLGVEDQRAGTRVTPRPPHPAGRRRDGMDGGSRPAVPRRPRPADRGARSTRSR